MRGLMLSEGTLSQGGLTSTHNGLKDVIAEARRALMEFEQEQQLFDPASLSAQQDLATAKKEPKHSAQKQEVLVTPPPRHLKSPSVT